MEGPKRYFSTTGKKDSYGHLEIIHINALFSGFDENNKLVPYIVIAQISYYGDIHSPKLIYSSIEFKNNINLIYTINQETKYVKTYNSKLKIIPSYKTNSETNRISINSEGLTPYNIGNVEIIGKNIEFETLEIIHVMIHFYDDSFTNDEHDFTKKMYFLSWYRLNNGKTIIYDEFDANLIDNCINCGSGYKFIERSKEGKAFCSKNCQIEHREIY